jgi:ABC-2 type transport system permease protein
MRISTWCAAMRESWARIAALARKDAAEVLSQPGLILPAVAMIVGLSLPAFFVLLVVPRVTGESLADSDFAEAASAVAARMPELSQLPLEGQAQAFVLQQFLVFSLLVPILGSLSLAAQAIVGEKQARSLEPLLATPITVPELLLGKVLTPFVLSMLLLAATFALYLGAMLMFGEAGVWRGLFWGRTLLLYLLIAPLFSFTALMVAAIVSSRVNDARTAQQLGGFLALPVTAVFVAQLTGQFLLGTTALVGTAVVLAVLNLGLLWLGIRVFQRETILMRWK